MKAILNALAKAGLVNLHEAAPEAPKQPDSGLDEDRLNQILAEDAARASLNGAISEGVEFTTLYANAQIPATPYSAEKVLKLLEGLKAMDPSTRKSAVMAMDAADDTWSMEEVVQDASKKCRALKLGIDGLQTQSAQVQESVKAELAELEQSGKAAIDQIQTQIADLQALLQQQIQTNASKNAELQAKVSAAIDAAARERARYEQEINRLGEIERVFGPAPTPAT